TISLQTPVGLYQMKKFHPELTGLTFQFVGFKVLQMQRQ
ncbi:hypothetical protein TVAGG3_0674950, partial [Trichomonas vaginalis G3]